MIRAQALKNISRILIAMAISATALSATDVAGDSGRSAANAAAPYTVSGQLTCSALAAGTYKCGKNQPRWSCTLQCVNQGSSYVLKAADKTYSVTGETALLQHFAADNVVVTGEVGNAGINIRSIDKQ
jgi:hypothetical protein